MAYLEQAPRPELKGIANVDNDTAFSRHNIDPGAVTVNLQTRYNVLEQDSYGPVVGMSTSSDFIARIGLVSLESCASK